MANTKISALPSYTGSAADLRFFVMNNSGENETFKFSGYTSPFKVGNSANSIVSISLASDKVAGPNDFVQGASNIISATGGQSTILGGEDNNITSAASGYNTIIGTFLGTVNNNFGGGLYSSRDVTLGGFFSAAIGANESTNTNGRTSVLVGGEGNNLAAQYSTLIGGQFNTNTGEKSSIIGGVSNTLTSSPNSAIIGGVSNTITGGTDIVMLGCSGRTATTSGTTFVENLVIFNYANLDFADDAAAATGGVVLGQVYHTSGDLKIRIT